MKRKDGDLKSINLEKRIKDFDKFKEKGGFKEYQPIDYKCQKKGPWSQQSFKASSYSFKARDHPGYPGLVWHQLD